LKKKLKVRKRKQETKPDSGYPVLIAVPVPMLDHKVSAYLTNFITGCAARKIALPMTVDSRNSENGRNKIIKDFMTNPDLERHSHLMFIDADTSPVDPYAVERLLSHDKQIISGITPIVHRHGEDGMNMYWNVRMPSTQRNLYLDEMPPTIFPCQYVGGSCVLVTREALSRLKPPYFKATYDKEQIGYTKGEDYYFCDMVRKAGMQVWIDPEVQCRHFHVQDMMETIMMLAKYAKQSTDGKIVASYEARIQELTDKLKEAQGVK